MGVVVLLSAGLVPLIAPGAARAASAAVQATSITTPYLDSVGIAATPDGKGYWEVGIDGGVFTFGDATFYGSLPGAGVSVSDIVGIAATPDGKGYWLYGADGGVFTFGDAGFYGSVPGVLGTAAPHPITDMVPTADGKGYWMVGSDGGVFTFGDAAFYGSLPGAGIVPNQARVAQSETYFAYVASSGTFLQPTPGGGGYWIADSTGDVYPFGDAQFYGSLPGVLGSAIAKPGVRSNDVATGHAANVPVTAFVATPDGHGYWMASTDGSVFAFGDAGFHGSLPGVGIDVPPVTITGFTRPSTVSVQIPTATVTDMVPTPDGGGYWLASLNGGVFAFGDAGFYGSVPAIPGAVLHSVASGS